MLKLYVAGNIGSNSVESILVDPIKVNVNLTTGSIEILDKHFDLIGNISNNTLEYTFLKENKTEVRTFFFRKGTFWVGNRNVVDLTLLAAVLAGIKLPPQPAVPIPNQKFDTSVIVYGDKIVELTPTTSEEPALKEMEVVRQKIEKEDEIIAKIDKPTLLQKTKRLLLEKEFYSCEQLIIFIRNYKKRGK